MVWPVHVSIVSSAIWSINACGEKLIKNMRVEPKSLGKEPTCLPTTGSVFKKGSKPTNTIFRVMNIHLSADVHDSTWFWTIKYSFTSCLRWSCGSFQHDVLLTSMEDVYLCKCIDTLYMRYIYILVNLCLAWTDAYMYEHVLTMCAHVLTFPPHMQTNRKKYFLHLHWMCTFSYIYIII